ncbi:MAG: hypothetical protein H7239_01160 [Flavobacterium sp.]|nr:hypothetical protein [Flavobacterium sp.]
MKNIIKCGLVVFVLLSNFVVFAQPGDENNTGNLQGNDPAPAPINGKLIFLAIAGIAYAIYFYKNYNKKQA